MGSAVGSAVGSVRTLTPMTADYLHDGPDRPPAQPARRRLARGEAAAWPPGGLADIRTPALARWVRDWEWWRTQPEAARAPAHWALHHACLEKLDTLGEVLAGCGRDRSVPEEIADSRLAAVVAEARAGDVTAARLALQRVLPALLRRACRRARLGRRTMGDILDDLLCSAWLCIVDYPLERRPVKIAVNVVRDAEYRVYGYVPIVERNSVLMPVEEMPERPARIDGQPEDARTEAAPQLFDTIVDAVAEGFPIDDARLLAELFVYGVPVDDMAARDGVSPRAVRYRRSTALKQLTRWFRPTPSETSRHPRPAGHDRPDPVTTP